jgi:hypothetical protein
VSTAALAIERLWGALLTRAVCLRCVVCCCAHAHRQSSYAEFTVSSLHKIYLDASSCLQLELSATRRRAAAAAKQQQQRAQASLLSQEQLQQLTPLAAAAAAAAAAAGGGAGASSNRVLQQPLCVGEEVLELQLVQLLLGLLHAELGAGHCEAALAKMQVGGCECVSE